MFDLIRRAIDRRRNKRFWETKWGRDDYNPGWLEAGGARQQIVSVVEEGWLAPGSSVLDIGCGVGNTAIWLAQRGFDVVGIDLAAAAIERAQRDSAGVKNVRFEVADVSRPVDLGREFDVMLDLGCLHQLPVYLWGEYKQNLLSWSRPGTRMLMLMKTWGDEGHKTDHVPTFLAPEFTILSTSEANLAAQNHAKAHPGLFMRVERRKD